MSLQQKCTCGSKKFKAAFTLELQGVPVTLRRDGSMSYNDTQAEYTDGWDVSSQPEISCAECDKVYELEQRDEDNKDDRPTYVLKDMTVEEDS